MKEAQFNLLSLRMKAACIVSLLFAEITGFCSQIQADLPLDITRVQADGKIFNPSEDEQVNISFEVTRKADIHLMIYDALGQVVRSFDLPDSQAGRHVVSWDGRTPDNVFASGELFLFVIKATDERGRSIFYNRARETGGLEVKSLEYTLDRETGKIEYVLPNTCMIRIRAGLKDGLFAKTLIDWQPQLPGRHHFIWDGKDESGLINLLKHPNLDLRLTCYALPDNVIIMTGKTIPLTENIDNIGEKESHREEIWGTKGKYLHYSHDPGVCHAPAFRVLFPSASNQEHNENPIVTGNTPIRVEIDEKDLQHLINTRFEVMFFVDGVYIYEVEEGTSPFTFHWDTADFAKGPHIVTINIIGYDDHIGIVSKKLIVGESHE